MQEDSDGPDAEESLIIVFSEKSPFPDLSGRWSMPLPPLRHIMTHQTETSESTDLTKPTTSSQTVSVGFFHMAGEYMAVA